MSTRPLRGRLTSENQPVTMMLERPGQDTTKRPAPDRPAAGTTPAPRTALTHPHRWIGAATVDLDDKTAKHADLRGSFRTKEPDVQIRVLEVYCRGCRRPYEYVADGPCEALVNNDHLIGGNPGERKKRKGEVTPAPAGTQRPRSGLS